MSAISADARGGGEGGVCKSVKLGLGLRLGLGLGLVLVLVLGRFSDNTASISSLVRRLRR